MAVRGGFMDYIRTVLDKAISVNSIYTIHYFEYTKDFSYSGEMHDFWEIVYADKKSVVITAGSKELTLKAGQMYIHRPNEFHKIRCDGTRAANSVILSFDCDSEALMAVAGMVIDCTAEEKRLMGRIISEATDAFSTDLGLSYTRELEKSEDGDFGCEQLVQIYMEQLLISLIRGHKRNVPAKNEENSKLLLQMCEFLQANINNKLCFEDIKKEFNLSASVIKRLFQSGMGCGAMEHFVRLKIDAAKQMIRENEFNFTEISEQLGFNTPQYFSTVFRRVSGMTPSEYESSVKSNFTEK